MLPRVLNSLLVALVLLIVSTSAVHNGLGRTPHMGWNTWNIYGCDATEDLVKASAREVVSRGLLAAGYKYLTIDDCWQISRNAAGVIQADNKTYPSGIKSLVDYVHSLGLKFGLYSSAGYKTCQGRPGSLGYEKIDALTYASWGVDMLRYDNCAANDESPQERYKTMGDALNATGRAIYYQMCDWGVAYPALWAPEMGNSWRTTVDITSNWLSMTQNLDLNNLWAKYAAPFGWNDADNLEVGNVGLSHEESKAHFAMWAMIKSPLMLGLDLANISKEILDIITAKEVIAVNQDPLGVQGRRIASYPSGKQEPYSLVWSNNCTASPNQQWVFNATNKSIRSLLDGRCLDIYNCTTEWLTLAMTAECGSNKKCGAQSWQWDNRTLISAWSHGCVTINSAQGPSVEMEGCSNDITPSRQWYYDEVSRTLSNVAVPGMCLEVRLNSNYEIWAGPIVNNSYAVALLNRSPAPGDITLFWEVLGISPGLTYTVRDLFAQVDHGVHRTSFTAAVPSHGVLMLKLSPAAI